MHALSGYWMEKLGVAINKASAAVARDERKGKKEGPRVKKINAKTAVK